jgi:sugar O-acyltransferase (sialic acid O-acetyltransferase NeuD family)
MKQLVILGAGGHGRVAADAARCRGEFDSIIFLDDSGEACAPGYRVAGKLSDFLTYCHDSAFFVAMGDNRLRKRLTQQLEAHGCTLATIVHPAAVIGAHVHIGAGTVVMAGAVVNPGAAIGQGVILNTACSVDHDCRIGDFSHISVGAHLAGTVSVGSGTLIGVGASVINNVSICGGCTIGAGAVVVRSIETPGTYVGVPAKRSK